MAKLLNPFRLRVGYLREKCICHKGHDPCREACSLSPTFGNYRLVGEIPGMHKKTFDKKYALYYYTDQPVGLLASYRS